MISLDEFRIRFDAIRKTGWVPSARRGPTGIGQTIEALLGLGENNIALPDLHEIELKAHRIGSKSMITLFTFNRKAWQMKPLEAVRKYGTHDLVNNRQGLYFTMSPRPGSTGLFLHIEDEAISVRHISGEIIAEWNLDALAAQFIRKIPGLLLVSALSEMRGDTEYFHYTRAQVLTGTSPDILREQILAGNVLVDLRLHDKVTRARNHGTGFRVFEDKLLQLFGNIEEI